jgi:hypothetical protein
MKCMSQYGSVSIVTDYGLEDMSSIPERGTNISLRHHCAHIGYRALPAFQMGSGTISSEIN